MSFPSWKCFSFWKDFTKIEMSSNITSNKFHDTKMTHHWCVFNYGTKFAIKYVHVIELVRLCFTAYIGSIPGFKIAIFFVPEYRNWFRGFTLNPEVYKFWLRFWKWLGGIPVIVPEFNLSIRKYEILNAVFEINHEQNVIPNPNIHIWKFPNQW